MTDRGFFIRSLIGRVNDEWLSGSGVRAEKHRLEDGNPDLLILELTGERLNDLRKEYGDHREGKLLLNWMLPTEEGTGCAVRDLYQGGGYSSPSLFHRPEFERNHADQAEGAAKDEKKSNVMSLCPDLERGVVLPSWLDYAKGLWRAFAKKIADGDAAISELARLEAGLNAIFVDARARTAARFDDDPAEKENPLGEIEGRRGVKINAAWGRGGLGRLRIPHGSGRNRLCPFETPESSRIGLNLHLSADAVVSDGRIEPGDRLLSVAVGMVPYPTHTDGPRLMMGGKNMKQAEPGIAGAEPPIVPGYYEGDEAYKIEALEGHRDENGRLSPSIGLNALTVVMPFKGYTYEDGLVVSESLAGRLTIPEGNYSFSKQFECVIRDEDMEALGIEKRSVQALLERFRAEQERAKGRRFVYGDPLPGFDLPLYDERSDEEEKENSPLKPYAWRDIYVHHAPGVLEKVDISIDLTRVESQSKTKPNHPSAHHMTVFLTWRFSVPRPLALGDKLTGRNGNKGVVTKILPDNAMPEVRFKDAPRRAELIISPSSIMGRKNLGQIWEMTHSLLLKELKMEDLADYELPGDAKYASHVAPLFRRLSEIGADERGTFEITGDGVPEGTRAFAGWQYFCRLHHHAWKKLQARGRYAPFEAATGQPMRCGARTGQRLGEMENWSLLSHGAGEVLSGMRTAQTGNFAKTRELLLAVLRSLGINAAGDDAGLHFVRGERRGRRAGGDAAKGPGLRRA